MPYAIFDPATLYALPHTTENQPMPQLTPAQAAKLRDDLRRLAGVLDGPANGQAPSAPDWQSIIAEILEQIGPMLIQLLISMLLQQPPKR